MNSDLMIFAIFGLILTILFVLVFVKDLEVSRKFSRYEKAIEGLIQELHAVKKQVANLDRSEPAEFDAAQIESSLEIRFYLIKKRKNKSKNNSDNKHPPKHRKLDR